MNKLIFHEGGQPVYLNDLQMLQEQFADMIGSFIDLLSYPQFNRATWEVAECNFYRYWRIGLNPEDSPNGTATTKNGFFWNLKLESYSSAVYPGTVTLAPGYVYIKGEMLKYERTTLSDSGLEDREFFVIVKSRDDDQRTLDNGETVNCVSRKYAVLSTERPEASEEYYSSRTMKSVVESLYSKMYFRYSRRNYEGGIITD